MMISKPVENAGEQVAAMDRHIRALERGWVDVAPAEFTGCAGRFSACRAGPSWECAWAAYRAHNRLIPMA